MSYRIVVSCAFMTLCFLDTCPAGIRHVPSAYTTIQAGHGPKLNIQSAISAAISGDSVQIAGDQAAYIESSLDPGVKSLTLRPIGSVTIQP